MIVLDASAAVEIVNQTPLGQGLTTLILTNEEIVAPDLIVAEVTSVIRKQVLRKEIERIHAPSRVQAAIELCDRLVETTSLQSEVLNESLRLAHSSYDMFYFVLARRCSATLFTADRKLADLCLAHGVNSICEAAL